MFNQAKYGDVDVITGDYLAEVNLANDAEAMRTSGHPGWIPTAWDGLQQTVELAAQKRIRIVINGGSLNPKGLAEKTYALVYHPIKNLTQGRLTHLAGQGEGPRSQDCIRRRRQLVAPERRATRQDQSR
jgi:hypothetical protein